MQIISRSENEGLVIGQDVVVTVLEIQTHFVRLGIATPKAAPYYREEILFYDDDGDGRIAGSDSVPNDVDPVAATAAL